MLKRDLIMIQIEELGKMIQSIIDFRLKNDTTKIPDLVERIFSSLQISRKTLLEDRAENLIEKLDGEDSEGKLRLEIAAKTLMEESYIYPDKKEEMLIKAKELLEYIQKHDNTFSLERVADIENINRLLRSCEEKNENQ